ncbi:MAG: ABC transporter ATP-binding protein [Deltaproteobacteria bacterium]|nr:ABC transporter ATP-binding protein [Deltaproteobacteria bacterium]MBW2297478.1 ABC transporter ATP-binding protein [Deltaproteobacteria bacterium]MBW2612044.1 ABC transporter ATP-binding protein [Deltaproteobacteria bacterium]MBW2678693.1 ABC transporter ATP-binding protein [Deltaproteobacteria bacterium]
MADIALKLKDVHKSFGNSKIINGLDLDIFRGERHAIIGPNGAGKSTVFNLVSGFYEVSSGDIELNGKAIANLEPYLINRQGLCRSFQVTNIFPKMSVFENVRCALFRPMGYRHSFWHLCGRQKKLNEKTEEVLEKIHMSDRRDIPAGLLAYAEQRALEIGITIAGEANVILLDEPTAGMSHSETDRAVELIRRVTEDKTLVVVEHDMSVVFNLADRISVLVYGEIIATDTPDNIRNNKEVQEAYLGQEVA